MLYIPIRCYGGEEDFDNQNLFVIVKKTRGNSLKLEDTSGMSFYIRATADDSILSCLKRLEGTGLGVPATYCHDNRSMILYEEDVGVFYNTDHTVAYNSNHTVTYDQYTTMKKADEMKKANEMNKGEKIQMNLELKNKLFYGEAPDRFGVSFDGRITFDNKAYNPEEKALIDTMGLSISIPLFVLPQTSIEAGDIIYADLASKKTALYYDGTSFIDYTTGQVSNFVPTKIFNMNFYSVVKNPLAGSFNGQNQMNNLLPLLLLKDSDKDNKDLFLMMAMCNGGLGNLFGVSNKDTNKTE